MPKDSAGNAISAPQYQGYPVDPSDGSIGSDQLPGSPYAGSSDYAVQTLVTSAKFLYGLERPASAGLFDIMGFQIDASTGSLAAIPGVNPYYPGTANNDPNTAALVVLEALAADPGGKFLFAATNNDGIQSYRIDPSTGQLELAWSIPTSEYPSNDYAITNMTIDPSGSTVYALSGVNGKVYAYRVDRASGALSMIAGSPFAAGPPPNQQCTCLATDTQGRFLFVSSPGYAANFAPNTSIFVFSIDPKTGDLVPVPGSPFSTDEGPISIFVHPAGKYLYAANSLSKTITVFAISSNGTLAPIQGSPFSVEASPQQLTVDPTGRYLYLATGTGISVFSISPDTGGLSSSGSDLTASSWFGGFSIVRPRP